MGRCSLAVILPVLSVMGVQPVALPTVVLSTHTGGFGTPARMDGAAYGMAALEHYHDLGLDFACIYTGYLGGEEQIALAEKAFDLWPAARKIVDPVMGDNGHAYSTVTPAFIDRMRELARRADLILPNATEAALLLQKDAAAGPLDDTAAQALADELDALAPNAVVTGLPWANTSAVPVPAGIALSSGSCTSTAASPARATCTEPFSSARSSRATPERCRRQRRRVRLAGHPEDSRRPGHPLRRLVRAAAAPALPAARVLRRPDDER